MFLVKSKKKEMIVEEKSKCLEMEIMDCPMVNTFLDKVKLDFLMIKLFFLCLTSIFSFFSL